MKRLSLAIALLAVPTAAAPALTAIADTLYKADGSRFDGVAEIEWKSFQSADGSEIPQQSLTIKVLSGQLRVSLVPTTNALKPAMYSVKFNSNGRTQFIEYWAVPPSALPLKLKNVRSAQQAGAITSGPIVINDVTGLRAELDVRASKGNAFAVSRAAVINSAGTLDGALGNAEDCLHVDGTSSPCGSGGGGGSALVFVDGETPSGAANGVNNSFLLANAPSPADSLNLFRNGMLMRQGVGYTISGASITFLAGSTPSSGDVLQAWYRIPGSGTSTIAFVSNETPSGLVDASNATFTLQSAPLPSSSLQIFRNGLLQRLGLDFTLSGSVITFSSGAVPYPGDVLQVNYRH